MFEDSRPHRLVASPEAVVASESRRDPTVELSINDLMTIARPQKPKQPATMELSISDVAVVAGIKRTNGHAQKRKAPPPTPRAAQPQALQGPHSAWDELALVQLNLPAEDEHEHFQHLLAVSEMWEKGAGDLDKAFEALSGAFRLDPDNEEARRALERLAESNGAWNQLVAVLDATIDETGNAERAVSLLIDSARVRERQGDAANAEERYQRALGMRPDDEGALSRLETVYRQSQRWGELATLLERRLHGLMERMPASEARKLRALELADVYERMGNTYEAIDAWTHVAREYPDHAPAFANLARLYEAVGQWSKVIESLTRELDVLDSRRQDGAGGGARHPAAHRRHLREGAGAARARHRGLRRRARRRCRRRRGGGGARAAVREARTLEGSGGALRAARREDGPRDARGAVREARGAAHRSHRRSRGRGGGVAPAAQDESGRRQHRVAPRARARTGRARRRAGRGLAHAHPRGQACRRDQAGAGADARGARRARGAARGCGDGGADLRARARAGARGSARARRAGQAAPGRRRLGRLRGGARARGGGGGEPGAGRGRARRRGARAHGAAQG